MDALPATWQLGGVDDEARRSGRSPAIAIARSVTVVGGASGVQRRSTHCTLIRLQSLLSHHSATIRTAIVVMLRVAVARLRSLSPTVRLV